MIELIRSIVGSVMFMRLRERKARSAVSPASIAVRAEYSGEATLDHLTVRHVASAPNENRYGVFARGSNTRLTLRSVRIVCSSQADGAAAVRGRVGTKGSAGGPGGDGAGGPSYAIFQGAGATVTQQNTKLEHGAAGKSMGEGAAGTASDQGTSD